MPSLSDLFGKPSLSGGTVGGTADNKINFSLASAQDLLKEGVVKVKNVFGDIKNPFGKVSTSTPGISLKPPKEGTPPAGQIKAATQSADAGDTSTTHKVKLEASVSDGESIAIQNDVNFVVEPLMQRVVEFDVMPEVQEIRNAEYEAISAPQMPTEFMKYKGTKGTQWQIAGVLTARTRAEAYRNYIYIGNLRSWTMPYFGENQRIQFGDGGSRGKLGAPPPVLQFSGWRGLVGKVPVVLVALNWSWPKDCDWIPTGIKDEEDREIPFPTVMQVNINLVESFSPNQVNAFDLVSFRNGRMVDAWRAESTQPSRPKVSEALGGNGGNQSAIGGTPEPYSNEGRNSALTSTTADYSNEGRNYSIQRDSSNDARNYTLTPDERILREGVRFKGPSEETTTDPVIEQTPFTVGA